MEAQLERIIAADFPAEAEIIVVDNRSTDKTAEIIKRFSGRDSRVRRVPAPARAGVNYARNTGVLASRYPYILIFDADDLLDPTLLPAFIDLFKRANFVGGGYRELVWDPATASFQPGHLRVQPALTPDHMPYPLGGALGITRSLFLQIGGFDESYVGGHDEVDFTMRAYAAGAQFGWLDQPLISYRQRSNLRASLRQKFNYARTSVQLVLNFSPRLDSTLPGYRLLIRKEAVALYRALKNLRTGQKQRELEGLAWTTGRLYGALLYRAFKQLPGRQLLFDPQQSHTESAVAPAQLNFLTPWDMDDENSWSGVCYRAVRALEEEADTRQIAVPKVKDAVIDRLLAKILGKKGLAYLPDHALCTAFKRSLATRATVKKAGPGTVIAFAASVDCLFLPRQQRVVQVTDSSFRAMAQTYFAGEKRLSRLSLWQGQLIDRWVARRAAAYSLASDWSLETVRDDLKLHRKKLLTNPFGPGTLPGSYAEPYRGGPLKIIFIGSDWQRKGGDRVISLLEDVRTRRDIELTVVGQENRHLPAWVRSLPRLSRQQLSGEYAGHHLLIELSTASAGGVVVTDALAHGLAALTTDLGGLKTLVKGNGWRISGQSSSRAAVDLLVGLSAEDIRQAQAEARRMYEQDINWRRWAQRILEIV